MEETCIMDNPTKSTVATLAQKATRIRLFDFLTVPMRTFHLTWLAFFVCFFAWFAVAPLMAIVRKEMSLTDAQVGNIIIASGAITILARLLIGKLCDRFGPRITYSILLFVGAFPVMCLGLARNYESFLILRLAIGAIGASFVITQYHTSLMFAPNCVGTANATTAGWGNMGGGAAQIAMPLLFALIVGLGISEFWSWRIAMIVPGLLMLVLSIAYFFLTKDTPQGNLSELRGRGIEASTGKSKGTFMEAAADRRVWMLALIYAFSFGLEIIIHNVAALHFVDRFKLSVTGAGLIVGIFGLLAIFARTMGGWISDRVYLRAGLRGRATVLGVSLLAQGIFLMTFSQMNTVAMAVVMLICFGLFVHTTCGATYAIIPFVNPRAIGSVAGIVGAGGNLGAVFFGFLFKGGIAWTTAFLLMGIGVTVVSALAWYVRFSPEAEAQAHQNRLPAAGAEPVAVSAPAPSLSPAA